MTEKRCTECGEAKPVSEFSKHKRQKDGLQSQCKTCRARYYQEHKAEIAAQHIQYRQEHKAEIAVYQAQYQQEHKAELAEHYAQYRQEHKAEIAVYDAQYRQEHRDEAAEYHKQYRQTPNGKIANRAAKIRRRSSLGGGWIGTETLQAVIDASTGICPYCGNPFTDGHVDHIFPASLGGKATRDNLAYVCATCNLRKHDKTLPEFFEYLNTVEDGYEIPVEHLTRVIPYQHLEGIV